MMSVYDQPSPDLLVGTPGCSRPRARTFGGRTKGSSRCSRKPLWRRGGGDGDGGCVGVGIWYLKGGGLDLLLLLL
jgi:hypothetical protein